MAKILIISAVFSPEPVVSAKLSEDIASNLSILNHVTVIAPRPSRPLGFKFSLERKNNKYDVKTLKSFVCPESNIIGRFWESFSFGMACYRYIKNNYKNIDLIYMNSWPIFSQYFSVRASLKYNIPIITHVQDLYPESLINKKPIIRLILAFILKAIDKYVLKHSVMIIAISHKMKLSISKSRGVENNKIKVVQNWQDENLFIRFHTHKKIHTYLPKTNLCFMYLGNIGSVAGVELLIKAFEKSNLKNCNLIIAGSGSKREDLENLVKKRKILNITFIDVPSGKVPEIQDKADIMLLPIKRGAASSSIPSKLPAYMFSKKPIISCVDRDSYTAQIIEKSGSGWVIEPENIQLLSEKFKICSKLKNNELNIMGNNGFNYALRNLSKKNNLKNIISHISNHFSDDNI